MNATKTFSKNDCQNRIEIEMIRKLKHHCLVHCRIDLVVCSHDLTLLQFFKKYSLGKSIYSKRRGNITWVFHPALLLRDLSTNQIYLRNFPY